ncbi:hypothetical protein CSE16_20100 [Solibacillus sp. R5-41]|nr:hypothetical protein CSE16_20100 [Solibacillus sp. R5-41]
MLFCGLLKGADHLISILEDIQELALLIIILSSAMYCRQLKLTKWRRKLTKGEMTMYILTSIALPLYAVLYLAFLLGD